jgi:hypothetical protein
MYLNNRCNASFGHVILGHFKTLDVAIGSHVNFTVELEHPKIMSEAYGILEKVILFE